MSSPLLQEKKALVRRWLQAVLSKGDEEMVEDLFARGYVLHDPNFPEDVYGPEGVRRYVTAYRSAFPDIHFTVEDQLAEGDTVVTRWTARGTHLGGFLGLPPTGKRLRVSGIAFDRVIGGRLDEAWVGYHPFAGPAPKVALTGQGLAAVHAAFPDLRMAEADSVREGEKAAFRWVMSGTHRGEFAGATPTGRRIEAMGMDIVHIRNGEILEHWGEFDAIGLLRRLGVLPT